jgi:small-conductance mechanosensitive channel
MALGEGQWMNEYGWALLALVGVFTVSLYIRSYLNKQLDLWKTREGRYFDAEVLDYVRLMVTLFISALLATATFIVILEILRKAGDPQWIQAEMYLFDILAIIIIILVARLLVLVLRRIARRSRANVTAGKTLPSAVEFSSLLFSYIVYIGSIILVLLVILSAFINLDNAYSSMVEFVQNNSGNIAVTVVIVIGIYFVIKLEETILEDFKFRSTKFNPQVVDLMKASIRYALVVIAFLVVVFNIFTMIGMETVGVLLVVVTLTFISLAIALSYSTVQNIVSGLALMDTNPFNVGDRIRIMDNMMCDVIEEGLVFTKVRTLDGDVVDVPNVEIIKGRIFNYSRVSSHAVDIYFEASFEISHERVAKYVREAMEDVEGVLKDPKPEVRAVEIKGQNIRYEIIVFSKDVQRDDDIRSAIIMHLQDVFHTEGHKTLVG